ENSVGKVLASRRPPGVCARRIRRVPEGSARDLRASRRSGREVAGGTSGMADGGGAARRLAHGVLPRPREAARFRRVALGRLSEEAVSRGALFSVLLDGRSEGGSRVRSGGDKDRRLFCQ